MWNFTGSVFMTVGVADAHLASSVFSAVGFTVPPLIRVTACGTVMFDLESLVDQFFGSHHTYHVAENKFERFRGVLELISRFEFVFCRCENYIF